MSIWSHLYDNYDGLGQLYLKLRHCLSNNHHFFNSGYCIRNFGMQKLDANYGLAGLSSIITLRINLNVLISVTFDAFEVF